ncbi:Na+/H+ antiporter [Listeria ilorinensis]|uniref:Na+/H+ antiporter n=1 Tax=Listeria ilorinensis TaxID=2867439 RepID=UPI001EF51C61|nr:Na+/H+ antiporter [Listeria ilorinensis]
MELFLFVLLLLVAIFISNLINRFIPFVSIPLIQIGLGILIALLPLHYDLTLNPELFLVMFIAPLLFNDGVRTDKRALWRLKVPILVLALGLVFVTVLVIGYFVNWMIPTIPLAAAFALAASLAPTDAVAVSSLSGRINLPKRISHLLEGEGLMNDASGLTAFQFAIAAMVTGTFSLLNASVSFVVIAVGGVLVGLVLSFLKFQFLKWIRGLGMEDVTLQMLIQILTPFIVYLVAEELHVSGILAVVAAGIVHAVEQKKMDPQQVQLTMVSKSTWSVIIFVLNGLVFLILGTQLPSIVEVVWQDSGISNWQVLLYVLLITAALIILRFLWVYGYWMFEWRRDYKKQKRVQRPALRASILTSLSGVRGAVTLATALSIPFVLDNGELFPQRALIICLASGVILTTLLLATFILPILARKDETTADDARAEKMIRIKILQNVIRGLKEQMVPENQTATEQVISDYRRRLQNIEQEDQSHRMTTEEKEKRLEIINWQRDLTMELLENGQITPQNSYRYQHYLNLLESAIKQRIRTKIRMSSKFIVRLFWMLFHPKQWKKSDGKVRRFTKKQAAELKEIQFLRVENEKMIIERLKAEITPENASLLRPLLNEHLLWLARVKEERPVTRKRAQKEKVREVEVVGIQLERDNIQQLFETGKISRDLAREMRQNLNRLETYLYEEELV